jgi:hypothetical protein
MLDPFYRRGAVGDFRHQTAGMEQAILDTGALWRAN